MIAELLDGRLSGEERTAAFARIDADEALYEVLVETVRHRAAQRGESEPPTSGREGPLSDGDAL